MHFIVTLAATSSRNENVPLKLSNVLIRGRTGIDLRFMAFCCVRFSFEGFSLEGNKKDERHTRTESVVQTVSSMWPFSGQTISPLIVTIC